MIPLGPITLLILLVLVTFGLLDRPLRRLRLPHRATAAAIALTLLASLAEIEITPGLRTNLGGGVIPLAVAILRVAKASGWRERISTLMAATLTGGAVFLVGRWFPPGFPTELNLFYLDAQYLYGLIAALLAYATGRGWHMTFATAVLGVIGADLAHVLVSGGVTAELGVVQIGGGAHGTALIAAVTAVLLTDLFGEPWGARRRRRPGAETLPMGDAPGRR